MQSATCQNRFYTIESSKDSNDMCLNKHRLRILLLVGVLLLVGMATPARADIAPPEPPYGTNPIPGAETTHVRMVSETVLMEVDVEGLAHVTADFYMRNVGSETESMQVRFPFDTTSRGDLCKGLMPFRPISDLQAWVDDQQVAITLTYETIEYPVPTPNVWQVPCWANFPVIFPPAQDVHITVTYMAEPYDFYYDNQYYYDYILETGAGWQGTIGSAEIILRLPYLLDEYNYYGCTPDDCTVSENEVRWSFSAFEPDFNISAGVVPPPTWMRVLDGRADVAANPQDGEAWGRLGWAYKDVVMQMRGTRGDTAGQEMYTWSVEAYQQAVTLLPGDADWHYGYAELLCHHAEWEDWAMTQEELQSTWLACEEQLKAALDLNSAHERANKLLQSLIGISAPWVIDMSAYMPATPTPPTPSATYTPRPPTPRPTITHTAIRTTPRPSITLPPGTFRNLTPSPTIPIPVSTQTARPTATLPAPTALPAAAEAGGSPLLLALGMIGVAVALAVVWLVRKRGG